MKGVSALPYFCRCKRMGATAPRLRRIRTRVGVSFAPFGVGRPQAHGMCPSRQLHKPRRRAAPGSTPRDSMCLSCHSCHSCRFGRAKSAAILSPLSSLSTGSLHFRKSELLSILAFRGQERPPGNGRKLLSAATAEAADVLRDGSSGSSGGAAGKEARGGGATQIRTHFSRSPAEPEPSGEGTAKGSSKFASMEPEIGKPGGACSSGRPIGNRPGSQDPGRNPITGPVATLAPFFVLDPRASRPACLSAALAPTSPTRRSPRSPAAHPRRAHRTARAKRAVPARISHCSPRVREPPLRRSVAPTGHNFRLQGNASCSKTPQPPPGRRSTFPTG